MLRLVKLGIALQFFTVVARCFFEIPISFAYAGTMLASLALLFNVLAPRKAVTFLMVILFWTWAGETLGQTYGLFWVKYHYVKDHWPEPLRTILPAVIPWVWFMMMLPSWILARSLFSQRRQWFIPFATALLMTYWDLILDPIQVSRGLWVWEKANPHYFNIPIENFASWFLGTAIAIGSLQWISKEYQTRSLPSHSTIWAAYIYGGVMLFLLIDSPFTILRFAAGIGIGLTFLIIRRTQRHPSVFSTSVN